MHTTVINNIGHDKGVGVELIPSQGGWCLWCRMDWGCWTTRSCQHKALLSRIERGLTIGKGLAGQRPVNLGEVLSCRQPRTESGAYLKQGRRVFRVCRKDWWSRTTLSCWHKALLSRIECWLRIGKNLAACNSGRKPINLCGVLSYQNGGSAQALSEWAVSLF